MNKTMRGIGLLILGITIACTVDMEPLSEPAGSAPRATRPPAAKRNGVVFNDTVRAQLAARGIKVYDGTEPERTTVEEKWVVPGYPMWAQPYTDPDTVPAKYATQLEIRWPLVVETNFSPYIDNTEKGKLGSCGGTVVYNDAILTAGHCVISYVNVGKNKQTKRTKREKLRAYSITARLRRNGTSTPAHVQPHGANEVEKSFWRWSDWPGSDEDEYEMDHDFAILRLKTIIDPSIPSPSWTNLRHVPSPNSKNSDGTTKYYEAAHYPLAFQRDHRMYMSVGDLGELSDGFANVYNHRLGVEPGSSGAGLFRWGEQEDVVGIFISEDNGYDPEERRPGQTRTGFPNQVLMLDDTLIAEINGWINHPI